MAAKKTHDQFVGELSGRGITVVGMYKTTMIPIKLRCDIDGHEWDAVPNNVLRGHGCPECANRKRPGAPKKKTHVIEVFNNGTVLIDVSTKSNPSTTSIMDYDDFIKIEGKIFVNVHGYPETVHLGRNERVHKIVLPGVAMVDHENRIRTDNRRCNLRAATRSENCINKKIQSNNSSGVCGVCFDKESSKWMATISKNNKQKNLGRFIKFKDAVSARTAAEEDMFGEYRAKY